jgi:hypothetical protein
MIHDIITWEMKKKQKEDSIVNRVLEGSGTVEGKKTEM